MPPRARLELLGFKRTALLGPGLLWLVGRVRLTSGVTKGRATALIVGISPSHFFEIISRWLGVVHDVHMMLWGMALCCSTGSVASRCWGRSASLCPCLEDPNNSFGLGR